MWSFPGAYANRGSGTEQASSDVGPSDRIRTCGIVVPNHARYQLRYTRICPSFKTGLNSIHQEGRQRKKNFWQQRILAHSACLMIDVFLCLCYPIFLGV